MRGWRRPDRGVLFVVTGPSGVGKSTLVHAARQRIPDLGFSISATTRAPRPGEADGVDYHFLSPDAFEAAVQAGDFLEHASVYDRRYGTLRGPVEQALSAGGSLILDIDVEGHRQVRESGIEAVHIMILPPSLTALATRLRGRGTEEEAVIERRMAQVADQLRGVGEFDYLVVNDVLDTAHRAFQGILLAALSRRDIRQSLVDEVQAWLDR